ncbi:unnamed protein product [Mytilus coruscus]|uniref:Uncharacterized protein n=1 Tax=Mytilus coruscus TaxID=42192 RepID=A0A6J8A122_MYTCO|nr:unnamed protein product [Mytilus coruscus]
MNDLLMFDFKCVPSHISSNTKVAIVEFAGAKFKTFATTGESYIKYVTGGIINKLLRDLQNLQRIIICEEKYSFTPDVFKAATRQKRQTKDHVTIAHLKEKDEIISRGKFSKKAAITTGLGKKAVSNYLGKHLTELDIQADIIIDVDISLYWPRNPDSTFKFPVYVWLQKQKPEIYNITGILTILERAFPNKYIGAMLAIVLSMGEPGIVSSLLQFKEINESGVKRFKCTIDVDQYVKLYLKLYYPKNVEQEKLTLRKCANLQSRSQESLILDTPNMDATRKFVETTSKASAMPN